MKAIILTLIALCCQTAMSAQEQKEIMVIGTMHTVPKIIGASYRPLLRYAKKYAPEAILTEDIMPTDSLSMTKFTPRFVEKAEAMLKEGPRDDARMEMTMRKKLTEMTGEDFAFLRDEFLRRKDRANYHYYEFLATYGIKGPSSSMRNESDDLTHKLAIAMGIKELLPIDSHHNDSLYNATWIEAVNSGVKNGDVAIFFKMQKQDNRRRVVPALMGRLGRYTNRMEVLESHHMTNSLRYVEHPNDTTERARELWDERNMKMAHNIVKQMETSGAKKYLLVVGAGHVISIKKALAEIAPEVKVRLMCDE